MGKTARTQAKKSKTSNRHDRPSRTDVKRRQHSQLSSASVKTKTKSKKQSNNSVQQKRPNVPFTKHDHVLLVGEGDFSFARSLARNYEFASVTATSFDDARELRGKYPDVGATLDEFLGANEQIDTLGIVEQRRNGDVSHDDEEDDFAGFSNDEEGYVNDTTGSRQGSLIGKGRTAVHHGIDAMKLSTTHRKLLGLSAPYTKIVFNFPHVGGLSTDVNRQVRANQELLVGFFNAAKPLLATRARPARVLISDNKDEGEEEDYFDNDDEESDSAQDHADLTQGRILVTLFESAPYTLWNIRDLARHCGLQVIESFGFPWSMYPGYQHARTIGDIVTGKDRSDEGKRMGKWRGEERDARSYVFGLKEELDSKSAKSKKRKRKEGDGEDSD